MQALRVQLPSEKVCGSIGDVARIVRDHVLVQDRPLIRLLRSLGGNLKAGGTLTLWM